MIIWHFFSCISHLIPLSVRPSPHSVIPRSRSPAFPCSSIVYLYIFLPVSPLFFSSVLSVSTRTKKRRRFFSWENSWTGMLLRELGVRVESRFSGSCLALCSAIPPRVRRYFQCRVRTCSSLGKLSANLAQPDPGIVLPRSTCAAVHLASVSAPSLCHVIVFGFFRNSSLQWKKSFKILL